MQKAMILILFCVALTLSTGCIGTTATGPVTSTPTMTPTIPATTTTPISVVPSFTVPATPAYTRAFPLPEPVILNGFRNGTAQFTMPTSGEVNIHGRYYVGPGTRTEISTCADTRYRVTLSSRTSSVDNVLIFADNDVEKLHSGDDKTYNFMTGGKYYFTIQGCYDWEITLTNA
jgi:hypothetical protein